MHVLQLALFQVDGLFALSNSLLVHLLDRVFLLFSNTILLLFVAKISLFLQQALNLFNEVHVS